MTCDLRYAIRDLLSTMVILLSSMSFAAALHILDIRQGDAQIVLDAIVFVLVFGLQVLFYFYQLRSTKPSPIQTSEVSETSEV